MSHRNENEPLRLERRSDGRLWILSEEGARPVRAVPCFPWSAPTRLVSLRDEDGSERALVGDVVDLAPTSREALEATLACAGFVFEIEAVSAVVEEVEIRVWSVETRQGARQFQTPSDGWPRELADGGLLIRDVAGDLYIIRDPSALDDASRAHLWAFAD